MRRTDKQKKFYYSQPGLYEKKIEELREVEETVVWLLEKHVHARDCDKCLIWLYWALKDDISITPIKTAAVYIDTTVIHRLTSPGTITRCRRKIQNDLGMFLPTDEEVREGRNITEQAYKDWATNRMEDD